MHTVELLPSPSLAEAVRNLWHLLREAGLKSLADHPGPTNRPHLTVVTAASLSGLPPLPLPVAVELGEVAFLGRALVWLVMPTAQLAELHAEVWSALEYADPWPPPAEWRPHLSLALNVPPAQRPSALHLLADRPPTRGRLTAARTFNTRTRLASDL